MTLQELHRKYFVLYDELRQAQSSANMQPDQYKAMAAAIKHDYDQDLEDYRDDQLIEFGMQRFERKFKVAAYTPRRRWLFWWNPVAKKLLNQYKAEFSTYLASLDKSIREEKEFAKKLAECPTSAADTTSTALTVPSTTDVTTK